MTDLKISYYYKYLFADENYPLSNPLVLQIDITAAREQQKISKSRHEPINLSVSISGAVYTLCLTSFALMGLTSQRMVLV